MSKVYFTKDISSNGLIKIYKSLNTELKGKVAVKISTGEPGGHNFLNPNLIKDLVNNLDGTIVECCTAYEGRRFDPTEHFKVFEEHGFLNIAPCDILDANGEIKIPVNINKHLKGYNIVGSNITKYDSMLVLSHFKGHQMGGFGGALKNISIGLASKIGKVWIHTYGNTDDINKIWNYNEQDLFLESMAEACKAIIDYFKKENIVYINVANNLSIDCDCNSNPKRPEMADIGIFASTDPVALDKCCYDAIMNSDDQGKTSLVNRMLEKNAIHTVYEAEKLGLGNTDYEIINID